jgi:hypothetical protein
VVGKTDFSAARLVPKFGPGGWLCRLPRAVVWAPGASQASAAFVAACLCATDPTDLLGRVGSRLADPRAEPWPAFVIAAQRGDDLVAVVHGPVEVGVESAAGEQSRLFGGDEVGSWLNRVLHEATGLRAGEPPEEDPLTDLREGVVRASGFSLALGERPLQAKAATARPAEPVIALGSQRLEAEQAASVGGASVGVGAEDPTVVEPMGRPGAGATVVLSAIGKLTWDNGQVHELAGPALVGRDVAADEAVASGELVGIVPSGQNDSMSRVHAELRLRGGEVVVIDRGSTNGTFVWDEAARAWQRLAPGEPHVVRAGTVLAFGERTATFEALSG